LTLAAFTLLIVYAQINVIRYSKENFIFSNLPANEYTINISCTNTLKEIKKKSYDQDKSFSYLPKIDKNDVAVTFFFNMLASQCFYSSLPKR
jgi:hypothetical protein